MNHTWTERITVDPRVRGGKPCLRGWRITVFDILGYLAEGLTLAEILAYFPFLTEEDIEACRAYAEEAEVAMTV